MKRRQPPTREELLRRMQERPPNPHIAEVRKTIAKSRALRAQSTRLIAGKKAAK